MGRGKRYEGEQKLNVKKVVAVVAIIATVILCTWGVKKIINKSKAQIDKFAEISYFTSYANEKWGVINSKGETIVEPTYDMVIIPNSKKDIFVAYEKGEDNESYVVKAINSKNEQVYSEYDEVDALNNFNSENEFICESNTLKVKKDNLYGLINLDGSQIVPCEYEAIDTIKDTQNNLLVKKDGKLGVIDCTGNVIVEIKYSDISAINNKYENVFIVTDENKNKGVIGRNKTELLACVYTDVKPVYGDEIFIVKVNGKWRISSKLNTSEIDFNYADAKSIENNNIVVVNNQKYGIIGVDGTVKIEPSYQSLKHAFEDYYIAKKDGKFGVVTSTGEVVLAIEYESLVYNESSDCFAAKKSGDEKIYLIDRTLEEKVSTTQMSVIEGYIRAKVDDDYKYYNLKFEEKNNKEILTKNTLFVAKNNGKYGLVNKEGNVVVQYEYDDIVEQNEYGYIAVKKDGKWGAIDQFGNVVQEPAYTLKDTSDIVVIGKWYKVQGVNITYFVCQ